MHPQKLQPDSTLYIYYFEGKIAKEQQIVAKNYIGTWEEEGFSFMFFTAPSPAEVDKVLATNPHLLLRDTYEMSYEQWQGGKLEPKQIGSFLLSPPWFDVPEEEPSTVLTIDPGVVFGNGLHPTTSHCLMAIEIACAGGKVESMLDLGTGTGVLAIGAAKKGCKKVVAVDFNLLATKTALNNVCLNQLEKNVMVINGQAEDFTHIPTDLLVANIHYEIMKKIITSDGFLKQKWFILSGLLNPEVEKVESYLKSLPVHILKKWKGEGVWNTILGITATDNHKK